MRRKDFEILVAGPDDVWNELWVEICYNNDIPVFIIQEETFYEAILYHGDFKFMTLPLDELITTLQEAKVFLPGNEEAYIKVYNENRKLFESTKKKYLDDCKILKGQNYSVDILHSDVLLAKLINENQRLEATFYYHEEDIRLPVEALQTLLSEGRKMLMI